MAMDVGCLPSSVSSSRDKGKPQQHRKVDDCRLRLGSDRELTEGTIKGQFHGVEVGEQEETWETPKFLKISILRTLTCSAD